MMLSANGNRGVVMAATLLVLALVNWAIWTKEQHLAEGEVVYLELAPLDPRSLMQGDYMALDFEITNRIRDARAAQPAEGSDPLPGHGDVIVQLDAQRIAEFQRLDAGERTLGADELRISYRVRNGRIRFATDAFFFQEGHAERYESARYGQFRVNQRGEALLVSLHDAELALLGEMAR